MPIASASPFEVYQFTDATTLVGGTCSEGTGRPSRAVPTSCVRVGRGCSVLRTAGGPVDLDRHTARGGPRFDQLERCVPAGVGEQPRALADDHGIDEQD